MRLLKQTLKHHFLQVSATIWHLSIRKRVTKKVCILFEKTTELVWQKNLERLTEGVSVAELNIRSSFHNKPIAWENLHSAYTTWIKDVMLGKISYTVVYCTQFTWGNNPFYNSYRSCIQKHKHMGNMPLLYFIEEVVPCLVRQSICCSLSESSRQH